MGRPRSAWCWLCGWLGGTDGKCGPEPVIGTIGRHLDVSNDHIRAGRVSYPDQLMRIACGADHVESAVLQDAHDPFPDKGLVLADHDADLLGRAHGTKLFCRLGRRQPHMPKFR